jgi:uncharacterized YccA/Bax inhibitor family protein
MVGHYNPRRFSTGDPTMLDFVKRHTVTITIGVSFFVFGFFIVANILGLSERDVVVGLISGAVGGITMLVTAIVQERRSGAVSAHLA